MEELWKDVVGWEGLYQVSSLGGVRSCDRTVTYTRQDTGSTVTRRWPEKVLRQKLTAAGYFAVHLRDGDREAWPGVHVLVAKAFLDNPENLPTVNHKNAVKTKNTVENLEWASHQTQIKHAIAMGVVKLRGNTLYNLAFKEQVRAYYAANKPSLRLLAKQFNISERTAGRIVKGEYGDARTTPDNIRQLARDLRSRGMTLTAIAKQLGKGISTIHRFTKGMQ